MKQTTPQVVILGGGPGAVFAYYGALAAGYEAPDVQVWYNKQIHPVGAFWLHELPPNADIPVAPEFLRVDGVGTAEGYSMKQWGDIYPNSFDNYIGEELVVYNPYRALPALWEPINAKSDSMHWTLERVELLSESIPFVIATFPLTDEATNEYRKLKVPVFHADTPDGELFLGDNICTYNGLEDCKEVRVTQAFGKTCVEYPHHMAPNAIEIAEFLTGVLGVEGSVALVPELHPTVKALPETVIGHNHNILLTGRWATLNRGALSHDSWQDAKDFLGGKI